MKKLYCIVLIFLVACRWGDTSKEAAAPNYVDSSATGIPDTTIDDYDYGGLIDSTTSTVDSFIEQLPVTSINDGNEETQNVGRTPASVVGGAVEVEGTINDQGQLIFYCPQKLKEGQSIHVTAAVSNQVDPAIAKKIVYESVNNQNAALGEESIQMEELSSRELAILDSVKLELEDPSKRVEITPETDQVLWRKVNKGETAEWSWYIIPKKDEGGKAPVVLYLKAFTKNVGQPPKKTIQQYYTLSIDLPETVMQAFLRKLRDIDWLVGIIGAIIAYFIGMWRERKKQKEAK